jgi:uncharacterized cupin superfamily protein
MPKIDVLAIRPRKGSSYPAPFDEPCRGREALALGLAAGLTQFGVNLCRIPPGGWSSQRHWHAHEDEFVYVLEGELVLVDDQGAHSLKAGDCAGFKAGERNGHHLQNRSERPATFLVVGSRKDADCGEYPDIDLAFREGRYSGRGGYTHKDGRSYERSP